jgi:hypothetical protein
MPIFLGWSPLGRPLRAASRCQEKVPVPRVAIAPPPQPVKPDSRMVIKAMFFMQPQVGLRTAHVNLDQIRNSLTPLAGVT